jgi:hypothetical protein
MSLYHSARHDLLTMSFTTDMLLRCIMLLLPLLLPQLSIPPRPAGHGE